jgi:hypothetical protein
LLGFSRLLPLDASSTLGNPWADIAILLAFLAFGIISWRLRISYRLSIVAGLLFLVVAAVKVAAGQEDAANLIAVIAYYALVVGVSLAIVQYVRKERERRTVRARPGDRVVVLQSERPRFRTKMSALFRRVFHRRSP